MSDQQNKYHPKFTDSEMVRTIILFLVGVVTALLSIVFLVNILPT